MKKIKDLKIGDTVYVVSLNGLKKSKVIAVDSKHISLDNLGQYAYNTNPAFESKAYLRCGLDLKAVLYTSKDLLVYELQYMTKRAESL